MITKKLLHDIITFCNSYIDNKNILFSITKYPCFISIDVEVWKVLNDAIDDRKGGISENIHNEKEFIKFKETVLNQLPLLLKQVKTD